MVVLVAVCFVAVVVLFSVLVVVEADAQRVASKALRSLIILLEMDERSESASTVIDTNIKLLVRLNTFQWY